MTTRKTALETVRFNDNSMSIVEGWFGNSNSPTPANKIVFGGLNSEVTLSDSKLLKKQKSKNFDSSKVESIGSIGNNDNNDNEESRTSVIRSNQVKDVKKVKNVTTKAVSEVSKFPAPNLAPLEGAKSEKLKVNESECSQTGAFKRKRKKTRSKQKNIRRDNRDELAKPEHLQYASDNYAGRSLSEVSSN